MCVCVLLKSDEICSRVRPRSMPRRKESIEGQSTACIFRRSMQGQDVGKIVPTVPLYPSACTFLSIGEHRYSTPPRFFLDIFSISPCTQGPAFPGFLCLFPHSPIYNYLFHVQFPQAPNYSKGPVKLTGLLFEISFKILMW